MNTALVRNRWIKLPCASALVPPPRTHRHRYYGVLAPNSPLRNQVTAMPQPAPVHARADHVVSGLAKLGIAVRETVFYDDTKVRYLR